MVKNLFGSIWIFLCSSPMKVCMITSNYTHTLNLTAGKASKELGTVCVKKRHGIALKDTVMV